MSEDAKKEYQVTSPIKFEGKRYEVGDSILLTEELAKELHVVTPGEVTKQGQPEQEASAKASPSMALTAKTAINVIENSSLDEVKEFVIPETEGGTEDRKTVLKAFSEKLAEAEESSKEGK